jgi:hypothetical protein
MSINRPSALDNELMITTWLTDLTREYLPNDIFDSLSSDYINATGEEAPEMPNAIYLKLKSEVDKGRYTKVAMVKDLSASPTLGSNGDQRLNEEDITTKSFQMEYTDLSHATSNQAYGITARDKFPYRLFEQRVPLLARYFKQYFGKMRRQALLELQSENLEDAPHFNSGGFSPNWYVPNLGNADQPQYTSNAADWVDRIAGALVAAGTGNAATCTVTYVQRLEEWARTEAFIKPIDFADGGTGYIVTLPTPQARWLKHCIQAGNLGTIWRDAQAFSKEIRFMYPGLLGQIGGIKFVEDQRYPTLSLAGSASNVDSYKIDEAADYSISARYRGMGRADDGTSDPRDKSATARQCGFLLGQAALCEWMPEGFHWEWEYEQYDKYFGSGIFCSVGIKQPIFDVADNDSTTIQQDGSIVLPFAAPPELNNFESVT